MANPGGFKLFRTVDPTTVNVPIKEKFAKLTLSSNKKKQLAQQEEDPKPDPVKRSSVSRQLLSELNDLTKVTSDKSHEHPLLRSDSSSSKTMGHDHTPKAVQEDSVQLDVSDYMEALQLSGDGCTQRTVDVDVEGLSTQISNLTVQPETRLPPNISICISSTTEEDVDGDNDVESCITISDTSGSEIDHQLQHVEVQPEETSMAVSGQQVPTVAEVPSVPLSNDKVKRIEAFLRDVSFERREMIRRGQAEMSMEHTRLASADTESMSLDVDCTQLSSFSPSSSPLPTPTRHVDSSKRLADNDTEVNTLCSEELMNQTGPDNRNRLVDNDTEVNTLGSDQEQVDPDNSKRMADNDTEVNTMCSDQEQEDLDNSKRMANDDPEINTPDLDEALSETSAHHTTANGTNLDNTVPETSSETEQSPTRPTSASSAGGTEDMESSPAIQVSSINISAKINIKIHIPTLDSSSAESEDVENAAGQSPIESVPDSESHIKQQQEQLEKQQEPERSILVDDDSHDVGYLTRAEKLLNELYGKSWQTPDVIRILKRTSGSGSKAAPAAEIHTPLAENNRQPKARRAAATTAKKRAPPPPATPNESAVGDFSLFKRALHSNKLNSTHLPQVSRTERRPKRPPPRTNHVDEDRWRALIDSDSGTDASDDEDADETGRSPGSNGEENEDNGHVTYLDLTKAEVEVVSDPDVDNESPKFHKRLDDILRTCRATDKPKLPATPKTPLSPSSHHPTRRQLFTPNTGYEDDQLAKRIVDQAVDVGSLEELEIVYLPGTAVHKRVQEVKRKLGIATESPKSKPVFKLPTPQTAPPPSSKSVDRIRKVQKEQKTPMSKSVEGGKCSFIKSLEPQISRDRCDNEAYFYRENFAKNKEQLAAHLYDMFNARVFNNELNVPITWSKLLRNTAGRCKNKGRMQERKSVVELSVKVLTSADRLRCTLIHELCHAAAWVFNGEGGHGAVWRRWAQRANDKFPDLPPIRVCHNYNIEFKYTYKCTHCGTASHAHSRSRKVENLRCSICRGPITLFLNKKDKSGNIVPTPVREATGFAKFVKDNFQKHKRDNLTAAQVMRILSAEYAKEKGKGQVTKEDEATAQELIVGQVETLTLDDDDYA